MPTLHHTLDRSQSFIRAFIATARQTLQFPVVHFELVDDVLPRDTLLATPGTRAVHFLLTSAGLGRLREHGCYDEGDRVTPDLLEELIHRSEAHLRPADAQPRGLGTRSAFPLPQMRLAPPRRLSAERPLVWSRPQRRPELTP